MGDLEERIERQRRRLETGPGARAGAIRCVVAPYRICPLGAHIDHQGGPVLGTAIGAHTALSFAPAAGSELRASSENFEGEARVDLRDPERAPGSGWGAYPRAAAAALAERLPGRPVGLVARVGGPLPGAGLSSSAATLLAFLRAIAECNGLALEPREWVALSRRAENEFVGVASGILDPATIVASRRGHLVAIDSLAERWETLALGEGAPAHRILVGFTGTSRSLAATRFNQRVDECRVAARRLGELAGRPGAERLGEFDDAELEAHLPALPETGRRRTRHFAGERARVRRGLELWRAGDLAGFGALMNQSCRSSVENFETGAPELIRLQEILGGLPGVYGSRFSGAGFAGCCVALVEAGRAEACRDAAQRAFVASFPALARDARFALVDGEDGVRLA